MLDPDVSPTWMLECLQTEIHPRHELPALKEVLLGPGVHLEQGLAGDEPQQPGTIFISAPSRFLLHLTMFLVAPTLSRD